MSNSVSHQTVKTRLYFKDKTNDQKFAETIRNPLYKLAILTGVGR